MESIHRHALVYVTAGNREQALEIGRQIVDERLAACANVIDRMTSVYRWEGRLEQADEAVLLLKTRQELVARMTERVQQLHSYNVPCVVAVPIVAGNPDFLQWITDETDSPAPPPIA